MAAICYPEVMREEEIPSRSWENRPRLSREHEARFFASIEEADRFFGDEASMRSAMQQILRLLDENSIPYAILGTTALNAYGFAPMTIDLDLLLNAEGSKPSRRSIQRSPIMAFQPTSGSPASTQVTDVQSPSPIRTRPRLPFVAKRWRCCRCPASSSSCSPRV